MDERKYSAKAIKERLNEYRENERDIDNQIERLERLVAKMTSTSAKPITDMPRTPGVAGDRMGVYIGQKEELENSIRAAIETQGQERSNIEGLLKTLRHSDERAVIRMRYMDQESWKAVSKMLFGNRPDYEEKEEAYLRRTHKVHGTALVDIAKALEQDEQEQKPSSEQGKIS